MPLLHHSYYGSMIGCLTCSLYSYSIQSQNICEVAPHSRAYTLNCKENR